MVPLYAACIHDLDPGDFVRVECVACGHAELIPPSGLLVRLRLAPTTRIMDLERRFRCRKCNAKGKAVVTVTWGKEV